MTAEKELEAEPAPPPEWTPTQWEATSYQIVQVRDDSQSEIWQTIDYIDVDLVPALNADYGWQKYRVVKGAT